LVKPWDGALRGEHETLRRRAGMLNSLFRLDAAPEDRRVVFLWMLRQLVPETELHLRKEETILFPALERLVGKEHHAFTLLRENHRRLRSDLRQLAELLQDPERTEWEALREGARDFSEAVDRHDREQPHLLFEVLGYTLKHSELLALTRELEALARRAYEEEGWPRPAAPV